MPRKVVTRVEGNDEESALAALSFAEKGPVSYSDKFTYIARLTDPDEVASYIEGAIARNISFVLERVP